MRLNAPDHAVNSLIPRQRRSSQVHLPTPVRTDPQDCGCGLVAVPALGTFFARRACPTCGSGWLFLRETSCGRGVWGKSGSADG